MLRPGAVERVMRERDPPPHGCIPRKRALDEFPMLRVFEETLAAKEIFLRRIDADELDVGAVAEAIKQSWLERGPACGLFRADALPQIEIVFYLCTIVAFLGFIRVVIADRRI